MKTFGDKMATSVFNPASLINFENKKKNYTNTSCSDCFGQIIMIINNKNKYLTYLRTFLHENKGEKHGIFKLLW